MPDVKAIAMRYPDEVWNARNFDAADEIFTPSHHYHDPISPDLPLGPEGVRARTGTYVDAFPDCRVNIDDIAASGNIVVARWTWTGTNTGQLLGMPPTGRPVRINGIHWLRIDGEQIGETWVAADNLGIMIQLGVVPPPGGGPGAPITT